MSHTKSEHNIMKKGCKPLHLRSYSDDRKTLLHRHHSPGWTTHEPRTPLKSSRSWFSLFRRKKSPENKIVQQESCDLKTPEDDSWLSFFKKKVSKEKPPPLTCCRVNQEKLRKEEEQKALEEGREPEEWKPDITIINEESGNPVVCKTPLELQPQPPPQPPLPRAVEVMQENVKKTEPKPQEPCDQVSPRKSFNMQLPYEEFKTPIVSRPFPPVPSENLQPRKQSPFVSSDKFTDGTTFQPCKKFHKQSNSEVISATNIIKSTNLKTNNVISNLSKSNMKVKSHKKSYNNLQHLHKDSMSKISKTPKNFQDNSKQSDKISTKQQSAPKKVSVQYDYRSDSNQLLSKSSQQPKIKKDVIQDTVHEIKTHDRTGFQNKLTKVSLGPTKLAKTLSATDVNVEKLTQKVCSDVSKATRNLQKLTEKLTVKEKTLTQIQEENVNKNTITNKFILTHMSQKPIMEDIKMPRTKFVNLNIPSLKFPLVRGAQENLEPKKIVSSPSLTNVNKQRKLSNKSTIDFNDTRAIKSSITLSSKNIHNNILGKVSQVNMNAESTNKKKIKESWEKIKVDQKKHTTPNEDSFLSNLKGNYSYIGFSRKVRKVQNKSKLKLSSKRNEEIQCLLPSNIQPFIRPNEDMHTWSTPTSKGLISVRKQIKQSLKKSTKSSMNNDKCSKEPWFVECQKTYIDTLGKEEQCIKNSPCFRQNSITSEKTKGLYENLTGNQIMDSIISPSAYAKILGYGNKSVLEPRVRDSTECKREQFSTFSSSRTSKCNNTLPKDSELHRFNSQSGQVDNKSYIIKTHTIKGFQNKQKLKSPINKNYDKVSKEIKLQRQKIGPKEVMCSESSHSPSDVFLIDHNNKYIDSIFPEDFPNQKSCVLLDYCISPINQHKDLELKSKSTCNNIFSDTPEQSPHTVNDILIGSSNTNLTSTKTANKHIPFSYEKSYGQWNTIESRVEEKMVEEEQNDPWQEALTNVESIHTSLAKPSTPSSSLTSFKCPTNHIVKRTFSGFVGDPAWPLHRQSYKCEEITSDMNTKAPPPVDVSEKTVKKITKPVQTCDKHPAPRCKVPQHVDCKQKARTHPPCDVRPAPKPSYSECLKEPTPLHLFTECKLKKETSCPPKKKVKSYDGCAKKSEKEELVCPEESNKKKKNKIAKNKKGKTDDCDAEGEECADVKKFKLQNGSTKPPLKCASWRFASQLRSHSLSNFNTNHYANNENKSNFSGQSQLLIRTYSCSTFPSRGSIQCKRDENVSSPPTTDRSCRKIGEVQEESKKSEKTCVKLKVPGCKTPEFADCKEQAKRHIVETCTKIYPPQPSFSECIRDPPPEIRFTECRDIVEEKCPEVKREKSYDGCKPPTKKEIPCPPPRGQEQSKKKTECEEEKGGSLCDDEPKKWGRPNFSKPPMKCSSNQHFVGPQIQLKQFSHHYCNLNSPRSYVGECESKCQYPRQASSCTSIDPSKKSQMGFSTKSDIKSGSPSTDRSCRKVDSGVKKEIKSEKTCEKHQAPGCKTPTHTDCKLKPKEMLACKKVLTPKPSYSECIRDKTPPPPFTECKMKKYKVCPDSKKKVKSYDGCKEKDKHEAVECPELSQEEKPKPPKKKKEKPSECEKDVCINDEAFKLKTGYSKLPMKCSTVKITHHNLSPVRSYSDLKTDLSYEMKLPAQTSYSHCQMKNLQIRRYSEDKKNKPKSKYETVPCPDDPDPPCRPKQEDVTSGKVVSTKCGDAVVPTKHFIECRAPPKKKVFKCEQPKIVVIKVAKKVQEVVEVEKPKPKTYVDCPKPIPKRTGSPCDIVKEKPPPPPKKICPIIDKHFVECLKPPPKIQPTCEQPIIYKKEEEKPPPRPAGICRGNRLVKTFVECKKPPPRKRGIICDGPYEPRIEPCFGQVKISKDEKVSRKKCGVDPDDKTPACPEKKKKDERRKCSQYQSGTSITFPPRSAGSTMKYSTSQAIDNQNFSKYHIPAFFSKKNVISMMNFPSPKTSVKKDINKKIDIPVFPSAGITMSVSAHKTTDNVETLKKNGAPIFAPLTPGAVVNFSTSKSACKDNTDSCTKTKNQKDNSATASAGKCDSRDNIPPTTKQCTQPLQKIEMTCVKKTDKLKEDTKFVSSCRIPEASKIQNICHKTECSIANKDGAIEDLLATIKSWCSFFKARECCPEPDATKKENITLVPPFKAKPDDVEKKQLKTEKSKCSSLKPKERDDENSDKIIKVEMHAMGGDYPQPSKNDKCPKITMPGCRVPEYTNCSKQTRGEITKAENECIKIPAPKPSFSECTKELLPPHKFSECSADVNRKTNIVKSEPSACEIYFQKTKTKKPQKLTVAVELQHSDKVNAGEECAKLTTESQSYKENPLCQESKQCLLKQPNCEETVTSSLTPSESNIFHRLLNKKSKLPECQTKDICEPPEDAMKKYGKTDSQEVKNICHVSKEKVQECGNIQSSNKHAKNLDCQNKEIICEPPKDHKKTQETIKADSIIKPTPKDKKEEKGPETVEGVVCVPCDVPHSKSKKTTESKVVESDKRNEPCKKPTSTKDSKTAKSASSRIEISRNDEQNSKKSMFCCGNLQIQKRRRSTSPVSKDLACQINNKNIPYSGLNIDFSSTVNLHPSLNTIKKSSLKRTPLQIAVTPKKLRTRKSTHRGHSTTSGKKIKYKNQSSMLQKPPKIPDRKASSMKNYTSDKRSPEQKSQKSENLKKISEEKLINDARYLACIKKFPGIVGKAVLTDIWSYCQKDLRKNYILKVPDPAYPKLNPKFDLPHFSESSVFQANVEKEYEENEAGKDHQPQSSVETSEKLSQFDK